MWTNSGKTHSFFLFSIYFFLSILCVFAVLLQLRPVRGSDAGGHLADAPPSSPLNHGAHAFNFMKRFLALSARVELCTYPS